MAKRRRSLEALSDLARVRLGQAATLEQLRAATRALEVADRTESRKLHTDAEIVDYAVRFARGEV